MNENKRISNLRIKIVKWTTKNDEKCCGKTVYDDYNWTTREFYLQVSKVRENLRKSNGTEKHLLAN